jgi:hypothetical protein
MRYLARTFTLPASEHTSEMQWDLAFLSAKEFKKKYSMTDEQFNKYKSGE